MSFIIPMHLMGLFAWPIYAISTGNIAWAEVIILVLMFYWGMFGIGVGYHRGFSHRAHDMNPFLRYFSLLAASSTAEGSALVWVADHRRHHLYEDTERDPYNVKRSFWWAHMGWMLGGPTTTDYSNCGDLLKDPVVRHQHDHYLWWMLFSCFGVPLFLGFLVGRPLEALLLAGFTRLFLINQVTYMINSYAHYFGRRPYSTKITARDSFICAFLTNGEGWHNFHHRFPFDYRNGHRFFHWDPSKWMIGVFAALGMTKNLKRTEPMAIYRARIQTEMQRVDVVNPRWEELAQSMDQALLRWQAMSLEWQKLRRELEDKSTHGVEQLSLQMKALQEKMRDAKKEFKDLYSQWRSIGNSAASHS
jgi:stearoyl-CoA desaturase (delta-9 desaturase)